jgi:hypothetical protein
MQEHSVSGKEVMNVVDLPKAFRFLGPGWFVVHVIAIALVFYLGHALWR